MKDQLVVVPLETLRSVLAEEIQKHEKLRMIEAQKEQQAKNLYTINKVAKMLGRSHSKIKKLVEQNILKATADGLISEKSINEYLKSE
jgi:hypothetical protein